MNVQLKNIKFSEALSEETNAFTADLYIDGKKVGYCRNDGRGGCTDYYPYGVNVQDRELIRKAEEHFKAMPKVKAEGYDFTYQPTLESKIDDLFEDWLKAKEQKKMERRMKTCILVGKPNAPMYSYYNFKRPLSEISKTILQMNVERIKEKMSKDEVILNTNLEALGINV